LTRIGLLHRVAVRCLFVLSLGLLVQPGMSVLGMQASKHPTTQDAKPGVSKAADKEDGEKKPSDTEPQPYDKVITADAKTTTGIFLVHEVKQKFYYEIPEEELNKEFLWVVRIDKKPAAMEYDPAPPHRVVRWERRGNRVLLRSVGYAIVADETLPVAHAVRDANDDAILMAFKLETLGKNEAPVIDVTALFAGEISEFSEKDSLKKLKVGGLDPARSFVDRVTPYANNVEAEATHTYAATPDAESVSMVVHYSMVGLPDKPMRPRLFDDRVGYFSVKQTDFGRDEQRLPERKYICRWRLEKKEPSAALSEPIQPIVYYIDPATPLEWRPWIKRAVEDWRPALESAGFKNAIEAKDFPDDPAWSPEDARYSVIRWLPSATQNAVGPQITDPRSGEVLNSDICIFQNVINLLRDWYFVQVGPLDARASKLRLPDDLMGRLLEYVVAHEVGHTLGLEHNMKSSSLYPVEKLRDPQWLETMGHVASIMDYSRFNYVAQPEDHIPPADLVPRVGPYDIWAIHWGYAPIDASSPDAERSTLNKWTEDQEVKPWLRFSTAGANGSDPGENTEAVGDADPVYSTGLGLKNLERVMQMAIPATSQDGEPYDDLKEVYGQILQQWELEMNHVANLVGSVDSVGRHAGDAGVVFSPVPVARQRAAVQFLDENAFATPRVLFLVPPDLLRRIEPDGALAHIRELQVGVLNNLLGDDGVARLIEQGGLDPAGGYKPMDFLQDLHAGIWSELRQSRVAIDPYRRNLQRAYVDILAAKIAAAQDPKNLQPYFRGELETLRSEAARALPTAANGDTRDHLAFIVARIDRSFDARNESPQPPKPEEHPAGFDSESGRTLY